MAGISLMHVPYKGKWCDAGPDPPTPGRIHATAPRRALRRRANRKLRVPASLQKPTRRARVARSRYLPGFDCWDVWVEAPCARAPSPIPESRDLVKALRTPSFRSVCMRRGEAVGSTRRSLERSCEETERWASAGECGTIPRQRLTERLLSGPAMSQRSY